MLSGRPLRIVVIGSSTAEGVGAYPPQMSWANRFRIYLKALHPDSELINLGRGGLQTFHLVPSEHSAAPGRPRPDSERNITRALAFRPDAVIVQAPSNDAAANYGPAEQLVNFDLILAAGMTAGVPVWFCAPQPRQFAPEQVRIQVELRQAMRLRYGHLLIDAWEALATPEGLLRPECDSGDGAHLNNRGHARLLERVLYANIPRALADATCKPDYWTHRVPVLAEWAKQSRQIPSTKQRVLAWGRLIRWPNLLVVVLAQALPYWGIWRPVALEQGVMPRLDGVLFGLLCLTTVLTAAGGYALNDYHDRDMDALNRRDRVVVGRLLKPRVVLGFYVLSVLAVLALAVTQAMILRAWWLAGVFGTACVALVLYAHWLKCTSLIGNGVVALLCGLVPLLPWWVEVAVLPISTPALQRAQVWVWAYAAFAFVMTLWREQVKTLEDTTGDAACRCLTLPVRSGWFLARDVAAFTGLLLAVALTTAAVWWAQLGAPTWQAVVGAIFLGAPMLALVVRLRSAAAPHQMTAISCWLKVLMLAGIMGLCAAYWAGS